jgi:DNA-binding NtrC family response regulator
MERARVLVVDDEPAVRRALHEGLSRRHDVAVAEDVPSGLRALEAAPQDVLLTDICMPGGGGAKLVREALAMQPELAVIAMSGEGSIAEFTELLHLGVVDCLLKPAPMADIERAVSRALELRRMSAENARLRTLLAPAIHVERLLGESAAMRVVRGEIARAAPTDATVLITGSSGTGKEIVARAIHDSGLRAKGPFVVVNCGALVESLLESELFGHLKGAFTGAEVDRIGCFEAATGGTLFLDEVGGMSEALQVRLLRVLASKEITRLGDRRQRHVDARIVAATNVPLQERVDAGTFRSDLYYRLAVVTIHLPDLAERGRGDIRLLAEQLCTATCERFGRPPKTLSEPAIARLAAHAWPGNVRELENALARAVIATGDAATIGAEDLVMRAGMASIPVASLPEEGMDLPAHLREMEVALIRQALERCGGNRTAAAELLGLQRTTLVQRLSRLGLAAATGEEQGS